MKFLWKRSALIAAGAATLLAAQTALAWPEARSLREVRTVWVDSNSCSTGINSQLRDRGFRVASSERTADAILAVDVQERSTRREDSADYRARLYGDNDAVIFTASGTEYARSYPDLCHEIGESIAESMEAMS